MCKTSRTNLRLNRIEVHRVTYLSFVATLFEEITCITSSIKLYRATIAHRPRSTFLSELFNIRSQFRYIEYYLRPCSRHFILLFSTRQWFLTRVAKWTTWIHRVQNSTPIKAIYSSTNIYHLNYCTFRELNGTASPCYLCSPYNYSIYTM